MQDGAQAWYLAQLKPNALRLAERNLRRQGFEVFLPMEETTRRRRGRFVAEIAPVFPGYLFVSFDPEAGRWRAINSTTGVARLVAFGNVPARVPDDLVEGLRQRCDSEDRLTSADTLTPGLEVRLTKGPFADFLATIDRVAPDRRIWVLLDIMGGKTRVAVSADSVQRT